MKKMTPIFNKATSGIGLLLIILLILPILIYSFYQVMQKSQDEQMIRDIYNRQLDVILYSVNQFGWNQYQLWEESFFDGLVNQSAPITGGDLDKITIDLIRKYPSLVGSFMMLHDKSSIFSFEEGIKIDTPNSQKLYAKDLQDILLQNQDEQTQNIRNAEAGYFRPLIAKWNSTIEEEITLFIFPLNKNSHFNPGDIGGLFLNNNVFIQNNLNQKIKSIISENTNLIMGLYHESQAEVVFSSSDVLMPPFDRSEKVWLLPDYELVIKSEGMSISALAKKRMRINLFFLIAVNLLVLSGIIVFIYNMNQQMQLAQMKTDFVANVSHELRTPLALIRMYAETLEMDRLKDPVKIKSYYKTIIQESQRLSQLINNILDFSRIESNKKRYQLSAQSIGGILEEVLETYDYHLKKLNVNLDKDIIEPIPELDLDKEAVTQVIINLIDNAIKFSPGKKEIKIKLQKLEHEVELSIRDYGIGIPHSEQNLIFNKFYRVGTSLVHNTKGSGLGLTLVKHIIQVHKGRVVVESQPEEGSTFRLFFPVMKSKQ